VFLFLEVVLDRDKVVENVCSNVVSMRLLLALFYCSHSLQADKLRAQGNVSRSEWQVRNR